MVRIHEKIAIDSLKLRIPWGFIEVKNNEFLRELAIVEIETGDIIEKDFKKNSYKFNENGISIYMQKERRAYIVDNGETKTTESIEYLVVLFSAKILEERYFEGINYSNIERVYKSLISLDMVHFSYETFLEGSVYDIDFKEDCAMEHDETKKFIENLKINWHPTSKRDAGFHAFGKRNKSGSFTNLGIEFAKRTNRNVQARPYLKFYQKDLELEKKSLLFKQTYFEGKEIPQILRKEATLKDKKHIDDVFGTDNTLRSMLDILEDQEQAKKVFFNHFKKHFSKMTRNVDENNTVADKVLKSAIDYSLSLGGSLDACLMFILRGLEDQQARRRTRTRIEKLYAESKQKVASEAYFEEFLKYMPISDKY